MLRFTAFTQFPKNIFYYLSTCLGKHTWSVRIECTEILFCGVILMYSVHQLPAGRHSAHLLGATKLACVFPRMMFIVNGSNPKQSQRWLQPTPGGGGEPGEHWGGKQEVDSCPYFADSQVLAYSKWSRLGFTSLKESWCSVEWAFQWEETGFRLLVLLGEIERLCFAVLLFSKRVMTSLQFSQGQTIKLSDEDMVRWMRMHGKGTFAHSILEGMETSGTGF